MTRSSPMRRNLQKPSQKWSARTSGLDPNSRRSLYVMILRGTADRATKASGSQRFFDTAGSKDKTLKLYEGHFHDLLNDVGKELVMSDIKDWIDTRLPATAERSAR
jgi:alpha-beta hydrolase superfamily lysophospholipase